MNTTTVGPHNFKPLRWWHRFKRDGQCKICFETKSWHPVRVWAPARPLGDYSSRRTLPR